MLTLDIIEARAKTLGWPTRRAWSIYEKKARKGVDGSKKGGHSPPIGSEGNTPQAGRGCNPKIELRANGSPLGETPS